MEEFCMKIIVVGDGKVGHAVAEQLVSEEHDVTVIESDDNVIQHDQDSIDAMYLKGNGANAKILLDAGVDRCDIVVAATNSDETNMLCCLIAKRLGAKYTIARIRDPEFNESQMLLQQQLGIDLAINPERASANEISRLLRYPFAGSIETFARGQVEMVDFRVREDDTFIGIPMKEIHARIPSMPKILYPVVERDGEVIIPDGNFAFKSGDRVFVIGEPMTVSSYFRFIDRDSFRIRSLMTLGGGRITYYLAKMVIPMGIHMTIIELNPEKSRILSEQLPKADVILGDGTDQELLTEQGLELMDAFVALCDRDEENLMTGMYASQRGVRRVIAKNSRAAYADILSRIGLDAIISPKDITTATILRYVRARSNGAGTNMERLYKMLNGKVEAIEFIAREEDKYIGRPIRELKISAGTLIAVIVRQNKVIIPFGNDHIEANDHIVVISREQGIADLNEVISL